MDVNTKVAKNMKQAAEIFVEYTDVINAAIGSYINDKSGIDDIFQDFFLSLVERPIPRRDQNIKAFINRAIRNDVLDAASKTRNYHLRNHKYAEINNDRLKSKTPVDIASNAEEIHQLFGIVKSQLLNHEVEAITQKYRYGRDAGEIAKVMGINRKSVSCYLCTGLKKLRTFVHQERPLDDDYLYEADTLA